MLVSQQELMDLTGRKRPSAIGRQLAQMGIKYAIAADGWPRVLRIEAERALTHESRTLPGTQPDINSLNEWQNTH